MLIDYVGFWPSIGAVQVSGVMAWIVDGEQTDLMLDQVIPVGLLILIHADGDDQDLRHLLLHGSERWKLCNAGDTPGSPEIEDDDLAPVVGQMDAAIAVRYCEVWGDAACLPGMTATIAAGGKQQKDGQDETGALH